MSEKNKDSQDEKVENYLFSGKWIEKEGIKWAFFESDKDRKKHNYVKSIPSDNETNSQNEKQIPSHTFPKEKIDKVSITELARLKGDSRYGNLSEDISSSGNLEPDTILSSRYKILDLYKSLEKRDFYLAKDMRLDCPCIVKELKGDFLSSEEKLYYSNRFKEEAKMLAYLSHPNLPSVMDYFIQNDRYFMIIDYIKGFDLETIIKNKKMDISEEQILLWGIDICDVLDYLHKQKPPIIHRDIRPENLFIREIDWAVILFNFDFARRQDKMCTRKVGIEGYAPPEQISGSPEPRSDIYSLGATLHHIITGAAPSVAFNFKPVSVYNPSVSIYTDMIIKRALHLDVEDRFSSAEEMKDALTEAYEKLAGKEDDEIYSKKDIFEELADMLYSKDHNRLKAIKGLARLGDMRATELLIPFLEDKSPAVRLSTINALECLGDKKAVSHISRLLGDNNFEVRKRAIETIEKITGKKIPPLMAVPVDGNLFF